MNLWIILIEFTKFITGFKSIMSNIKIGPLDKVYYVYRITNITLNKHYYGFRGTILYPLDDIGVKYFSSSADKEFILDQKTNPDKYKYKIIFKGDRASAQSLEVKLHKFYRVGTNDNFYNRATQTHSALIGTKEFSRKGADTKMATILENGLSIAQNASIKRAETMRSTIRADGLSKQEYAINKMVATRKSTILENGLSIAQLSSIKGAITRKSTILENGLTIEQDAVKRASITGRMNNSYTKAANKIYAERDKQYRLNKSANSARTMINDGIYIKTAEKHSEYQNEVMESGLTRAQETGLKVSKTRIAMHADGRLKPRTGSANPSAKVINIFDANDNIVFVCHGSFEKVCKENNLPRSPLKHSYLNDGKRYTISRGNKHSFRLEFENWYAKIEKKK